MEGWRAILLDGDWPANDLWYALGLAALAVVVGWFTFKRLEDGFADVL
jgi:ABC-type polysaccharide/polyol phosphate export permease